MTAREWQWHWGPTRTPLVRLERRTWNTLGDCRRDWWAVSISDARRFSQGFERLHNGAWYFHVGPVCIWHEPDVEV